MIERQLKRIPFARLQGSYDVPASAAANSEFGRGNAALHRERFQHTSAQIETVSSRLIATSNRSKVDGKMDRHIGFRMHGMRKHITQPIILQTVANANAAMAGRMNMSCRALSLRKNSIRTGRKPRRRGRLPIGLLFEIQIGSAGEQTSVQRGFFVSHDSHPLFDVFQSCGSGLITTSRFLTRNKSGEARRPFGFFASRKCPLSALQNSVDRVVVVRRHWIIFVIMTARAS